MAELILSPSVGGNLGVNTKNIYVARFTDVRANLTSDILQNVGLEVGDSIYFTDSANETVLAKIETGFVLAPFYTEQPENTAFRKTQGVVKITGRAGVKPSYSLSANTEQIIAYDQNTGAFDYSDGATHWPQQVITPADDLRYDSINNTFLENESEKQVHLWRFIFNISKSSTNTGIFVFLRNTLTGFEAKKYLAVNPEFTDDSIEVDLKTIATTTSLPSGTGQGYQLVVVADDPITTFELDNFAVTMLPNSYIPS